MSVDTATRRRAASLGQARAKRRDVGVAHASGADKSRDLQAFKDAEDGRPDPGLRQGLSLADEPFLTRALDDKRAEGRARIRHHAAGGVARIDTTCRTLNLVYEGPRLQPAARSSSMIDKMPHRLLPGVVEP
jgi:hypothetical protein